MTVLIYSLAIAFVLVEFTQNALRCSPLPAFGAVFGPLEFTLIQCRSFVGRQDGGQKLSLQKNGCLYGSTVQHEVLHALGFNHEQVRSDRDNYVSIHYENIGEGMEHNFDKKKTNNLGTPYDFTSVMQYPNDAFSKNGKPTIVAKSDPKMKFGHAAQLSVNDIIRVNKLYNCSILHILSKNINFTGDSVSITILFTHLIISTQIFETFCGNVMFSNPLDLNKACFKDTNFIKILF
uniref:Metalloendopeptidase n=1 Tax=Xiphophorus couchianus TaxID=32473 RepID=A0A3B5KY42_9TELE